MAIMRIRAGLGLLIFVLCTNCPSAPQVEWSAWSSWQPVEKDTIWLRSRFKQLKVKDGDAQGMFQFRNDSDQRAYFTFELHFKTRGNATTRQTSVAMRPHELWGSLIVCDPITGVSAITKQLRFVDRATNQPLSALR
jgi:hypothetical protein